MPRFSGFCHRKYAGSILLKLKVLKKFHFRRSADEGLYLVTAGIEKYGFADDLLPILVVDLTKNVVLCRHAGVIWMSDRHILMRQARCSRTTSRQPHGPVS